MGDQATTEICRLTDVEHGPSPVAEYIHAGGARCFASCAFADPAPMLVPILEDECPFDECPCEAGRRSANAQHLAGQLLIIRGLTGHNSSEQSISEHQVVRAALPSFLPT